MTDEVPSASIQSTGTLTQYRGGASFIPPVHELGYTTFQVGTKKSAWAKGRWGHWSSFLR